MSQARLFKWRHYVSAIIFAACTATAAIHSATTDAEALTQAGELRGDHATINRSCTNLQPSAGHAWPAVIYAPAVTQSSELMKSM